LSLVAGRRGRLWLCQQPEVMRVALWVSPRGAVLPRSSRLPDQ